ncbi:hypothetical protein V494_07564 [Pseudogymnoascus sp. VKM F-4513 (FW-928)]|nr:hypothetical protein V494_07564 [Pseudogymnoascus sp. VKM F-4513 (FW-928)]
MSSQPYDPYQPSGNGASSGGPKGHVDTAQLQQAKPATTANGPHAILDEDATWFAFAVLPVFSCGVQQTIEIDGATAKMQHNVDKLAQRGENLNSLQDKTDNLAVSAQGFNQGANRVRRQMWRSNMKWKIIVGAGIIILLLIIVVPIATHFSK